MKKIMALDHEVMSRREGDIETNVLGLFAADMDFDASTVKPFDTKDESGNFVFADENAFGHYLISIGLQPSFAAYIKTGMEVSEPLEIHPADVFY